MTVYDQLDRTIFLALNFDGGAIADNFFFCLSHNIAFTPVALLAIYLMIHRTGWRNALIATALIIAGVVLADQVCNLMKISIAKPRPTYNHDLTELVHTVKGRMGGMYGAFSAHAATVCVIAVASSKIVDIRRYTIAVFIWAAAVCYSRIYLGFHYLTDIIYGALTGYIFARMVLYLFGRYISHQKGRG